MGCQVNKLASTDINIYVVFWSLTICQLYGAQRHKRQNNKHLFSQK